ncbi:MAG TPA: hypothetical protein VFK05_34840 [Polyangiaceae bacterium]|nr:hypothetical protein [Polyangiaceae bacterium]
MRKLVAALVCSLLVVALLFGCSSEKPVAKGGCAQDAQCVSGLHCTPQHVCSQCAFDTQCPDSERCDRGSCVSRVPCSTNKDCPSAANPICDATLKECVSCGSDRDCDAAQRCLDHACQTPTGCASDSDCQDKQICAQGQCQDFCDADAECTGVGLVCDYSKHVCTQCLVNADCPSTYHCAEGRCARDGCVAGASRCTKDGKGVELCGPEGDRWLTLFCAASQNCDADQGKATCSGWLCTPGTGGCSKDARRVEVCSADGESTLVDHECSATQVCTAGTCKEVVCTPGLSYCKAGAVLRCSDDGTSSTSVQVCGADSFCDDATAQCSTNACKPGTQTCQGNAAVRCKADGSGFETTDDCGKSSICTNGACRALLCEPNTRSCDDQGHVLLCNASGTAVTVVDTCDSGQHCVQTASSTGCVANGCSANGSSCIGDVLVTCNADGSALQAATTDCAASNQVCYGGACRTKVCTPNTLSCEQGNVVLCVQNGTATQLFDVCSSDEYCDAASPSCKVKVCTPGAAACNNDTAATCNADGSGYLSSGAVDCTQSNKLCQNGACQTPFCTPNAFVCQAGDVYRCNAQGSATVLDTDCVDSYQHCAQSGNVAYCAADACYAGNTYCNGNIASKCLADGSGYETGTDCGTQVCVSGVCTPKICTPGSPTCTSGNAYVCNATGTAYTLAQGCSAAQFCSSGVCTPDVCPAGAQACVGEVLGVCNSEGSALSSSTTNCGTSQKACSLGGCVATVTDALATVSSTAYGSSSLLTMYGDFVYVSTPRRLKLMQHSLLQGNASALRWVIYQSDAAFGPYRPVYDQTAPVATPNSFTVQSSGALDVPLLAGKFYYFATVAAPNSMFSTESSTAQRFVSFGHVLGTYTGTFASTPSNSFSVTSFNTSFAPITLTTTLP